MAEKKKKSSKGPGGHLASVPLRCIAEECNQKPWRLNFCKEHFTWFKEGLITRDGGRAKDFDKKHQDFLARQKKKKAA